MVSGSFWVVSADFRCFRWFQQVSDRSSFLLSLIIFQIHTELLLHVKPSLLRNIFWIISVDNEI